MSGTVDIATLGLEVRSDGVVVASDRLKQLTAEGTKAEGAANKLSSSFSNVAKYIQLATAALASWQLYQYIKDATLLAARVETLRVVMHAVGNNAGYSAAQMDGFTQQIKKMGITTQESMNSLIKMAGAQMDLAQASKLARVAQDAAVIGNINSSEAFGRMIQGIRSGEAEILKTMGINVQLGDAQKKYAESLGKTTEQLTAAEKTQANMNAVLEYGKNIAGAYEASMSTAGKMMLSMSRYTEEFKLKLGEAFAPALTVLIEQMTVALKGADDVLGKNKSTVSAWGDVFREAVISTMAELQRFSMLIDKVGGALTTFNYIFYKTLELTVRFMTLGQMGDGLKNMADDAAALNKMLEERYKAGMKALEDLGQKSAGAPADAGKQAEVERAKLAAAAAQKVQVEKDAAAAGAALRLKAQKAAALAAEKAYQHEVDKIYNQSQAHLESLAYTEKQQQDDKLEAEKAFGIASEQIWQQTQTYIEDSIASEKERLQVLQEIQDLKNETQAINTSLIQDPFARERQMIQDNYDFKKELLDKEYDNAVESADKRQALLLKLDALDKQKTQDGVTLEVKATKSKLSTIADYAGMGAQLFATLADAQDQASRKGFESAKAMNIASAVMSTAAGIISAFANPGGYAGLAMAALAAVTGAAQIAKIASTSFGSTGSVSAPPGAFSVAGGGATGSGAGQGITAPYQSLHNSQTSEDMDRIAGSMDGAAIAMNKAAESLLSIGEMFKSNIMTMLMQIAPGRFTGTNQSGPAAIDNLTQFDNRAMDNFKISTALSDLSGTAAAAHLNELIASKIGEMAFGSKTYTQGAGITAQLVNGEFQTGGYLKKHKDGGWFTDSKTSYQNTPVDAAFQEGMTTFFSGIKTDMLTASKLFGMSAVDVESGFAGANTKLGRVATAGVKPEDYQKAWEIQVTAAANALANTIPGLKDFQLGGEELFATYSRLSNSMLNVNEALTLVGATLIPTTGAINDLAYTLETSMGGVEAFKEKMDTYFTSIFTESEQEAAKLAAATRTVNYAFAEMEGTTIPKTRTEFKALVSGLDLTTESGAATFASLINASEAFGIMMDSADKATEKLLEISQAMEDLQVRNLSAMGQTIAAQRMSNQLELQRAVADAEKNAMGAEYITRLKNTMALENAAWELSISIDAEKKRITEQTARDLEGLSERSEKSKAKVQADYDLKIKALQETQNKAIESAQKSIDGLADSASKLRSFADSLKSTLEEMRPYSMAEAQGLADRAIKTGNISNQDDLSRAVQTFSGINTSNYATKVDFDRDRLTNANRVEALGKIADGQASAAERALQYAKDQLETMITNHEKEMEALKAESTKQQESITLSANSQITAINQASAAQIAGLDSQMSAAVTQITALYSINNSVLSVAAAMQGFMSTAGVAMNPSTVTSTLPKFASGGITNRPAIFGEAGLEAAIPMPGGYIPVRISGMADNYNALLVEMAGMRAELKALLIQINKNTKASTDIAEDWDANGTPDVRVA